MNTIYLSTLKLRIQDDWTSLVKIKDEGKKDFKKER